MGERPEPLLERAQPPHRRPQEGAAEPDQQQDRREVGEQQVLDHVRGEQALLAEAVDRRARARSGRTSRPPANASARSASCAGVSPLRGAGVRRRSRSRHAYAPPASDTATSAGTFSDHV